MEGNLTFISTEIIEAQRVYHDYDGEIKVVNAAFADNPEERSLVGAVSKAFTHHWEALYKIRVLLRRPLAFLGRRVVLGVAAPANCHILVSASNDFNLFFTSPTFRVGRFSEAQHAHRRKLDDTFREWHQS